MSLRDRPRLSDRFRGKSGDELMKEFKKEFDNNINTMFDPDTDGSRFRLFRREGFPFSEDVFSKKSDPSRFEDLAKKHPEFVSDLRCPPWGGSIDKDWERAYTVPIAVEKCEPAEVGAEGAPSSQCHSSSSENHSQPESAESLGQQGLRHTVDIGEQIKKTNLEKLESEPKRSSSAPPNPSSESKKEPKRFTTKIEITPINPFERNSDMSSNSNDTVRPTSNDDCTSFNTRQANQPPSNQNNIGTTEPVADGTSARNEPLVDATEKSQNGECHSLPLNRNQPQVRHIPIFVEGRNETVIPKNEEVFMDQQLFPTDQASLKRKSDGSNADGFAASETGAPFKQNQTSSRERNIPVETPVTSASVSQSASKPTTSSPIPVPVSKPDPQQCVEQVQQDVDDLTKCVEQFNGTSRNDKEYLYLDEMLTRNLIKLDVIEVEGNEPLRAARKNVIKSIQKSIALLESKVPINNNVAADNNSEQTQKLETTENSDASSSIISGTVMEADSNKADTKGDKNEKK